MSARVMYQVMSDTTPSTRLAASTGADDDGNTTAAIDAAATNRLPSNFTPRFIG